MFSLAQKKFLVTGASGGIGEAIATALHTQGAIVTLSGTNASKLEKLAAHLGDNAYVLACNLSHTNEVETLVDRASDRMQGFDGIVCNAGVTKDMLTMRLKLEDWQRVLDINLTAAFILNKAAFKVTMKQKWGRIINITSVVGFTGNPGQANYCASKAGLVGMSKAIALEAATRNITVNCIAPGFIKTPMTDELTDKQKEQICATIPAKALGKPEDIANAVVFLASEEAAYITGQTIHVNGGMYTT